MTPTPSTAREVTTAKAFYQTDDVEIDDNAATSRADADGGRWVSAWVWVSDEMMADHTVE